MGTWMLLSIHDHDQASRHLLVAGAFVRLKDCEVSNVKWDHNPWITSTLTPLSQQIDQYQNASELVVVVVVIIVNLPSIVHW